MSDHSKENIGGLSVYVPIGASDTQSKKLAPRLTSLRGARIGILDNCKEFADVVLRGVADVLQREYGVADVRSGRRAISAYPRRTRRRWRRVRRRHQRRRPLRLFDTLDRA